MKGRSNGPKKKYIPKPPIMGERPGIDGHCNANKKITDEVERLRRKGYEGECKTCGAKNVHVTWQTAVPGKGRGYCCQVCIWLRDVEYATGMPSHKTRGLFRQQKGLCFLCGNPPGVGDEIETRLNPFPHKSDAKHLVCRKCSIMLSHVRNMCGMDTAMKILLGKI